MDRFQDGNGRLTATRRRSRHRCSHPARAPEPCYVRAVAAMPQARRPIAREGAATYSREFLAGRLPRRLSRLRCVANTAGDGSASSAAPLCCQRLSASSRLLRSEGKLFHVCRAKSQKSLMVTIPSSLVSMQRMSTSASLSVKGTCSAPPPPPPPPPGPKRARGQSRPPLTTVPRLCSAVRELANAQRV
jgi:hypothetical protein